MNPVFNHKPDSLISVIRQWFIDNPGERITNGEGFHRFNTLKMSNRIGELRVDPDPEFRMDVREEWRELENGKRVMEYWYVPVDRKQLALF